MDDAKDEPARPPPKLPATSAPDSRESRLAAALRANLRRRKSGRPGKPVQPES